jgi:hypothetical protein
VIHIYISSKLTVLLVVAVAARAAVTAQRSEWLSVRTAGQKAGRAQRMRACASVSTCVSVSSASRVLPTV